MRPNLFVPFLTLLIFTSSDVRAGPVTMFTDIDEWRVAASAVGTGMVHEIDFETLPDGSPSVAGTLITPDFNYTDQGVTFLTPFPELRIGTPPQGGGFPLFATAGDTSLRNWIIADFVTPVSAVGFVFPGNSTLSVFDAEEVLIDSISFAGSGAGFFLGIVSDDPITIATGDRGSSGEIWESFLFTPVPEPGTLWLLALGTVIVVRRRSREVRRSNRPASHIALLLALTLLIFASSDVHAGPVTTFTDIDEWRVAASAVGTGMVHEIDFETLPDGSPSVAGTLITPDFNYTDQGVTFLTPFPELRVEPITSIGFELFATAGDTGLRNWIIADLVTPALAVGIIIPGSTMLSAFDLDGRLITTLTGGGPGVGHFLGVISDVPIALATGDRGSSAEVWESFLFTPVPEPGTLVLLAGGAAVVLRRRRRWSSSGSRATLQMPFTTAAVIGLKLELG